MSRRKNRDTNPSPPTPPSRLNLFLQWWPVMIVVAGLAIFLIWPGDRSDAGKQAESRLSSSQRGEDATADKSSTDKSEPAKAVEAARPEDLIGKWVRTDPDSNYTLDIKSVAPDGKTDIAYFNPRPIRVSQSQVTNTRLGTLIHVELRDIPAHYHGCLYDLVFDPKSKTLKGNYFQASQGANFDVEFIRVPPSDAKP